MKSMSRRHASGALLFNAFGRLAGSIIACLFILSATFAFAQTADTGTIEGRVKNSAAGNYLNNARIRIPGTSEETYTNSFGEYSFQNISADKEITIEAYYTGLPTAKRTVKPMAGTTVTCDIEMSALAASQSGSVNEDSDVVKLEAFVVSTSKETNAAALAINEQRFSTNLKNVVSTDAYGEINQGNIGEFMKHMPGVTIEYKDGNTPTGIQVRGFSSNYTAVTVDGGAMASTASPDATQNSFRTFSLEQSNINNFSRVEVSKLPLPDMAANLLGGSVNLVSKSAFEYTKPSFNATGYIMMNGDHMSFSKSPGPGNNNQNKAMPSGDFSLVIPLSKTFGIVLSGASSSQYMRTDTSTPTRDFKTNWGGTGTNAYGPTTTNPATKAFKGASSYASNERDSIALKMDWRPWRRHLFSLSLQANAYESETRGQALSLNADKLQKGQWGETYSIGVANNPNANANQSTSMVEKHGLSQGVLLNYTYTGNEWKLSSAFNYSYSRNQTGDAQHGFVRSYSTRMLDVKQINFYDINNDNGTPGRIETLNATGNSVDVNDISKYALQSVQMMPTQSIDTVTDWRADAARTLRFGSVPFTLKAGIRYNDVKRDVDYNELWYDYVGPNNKPVGTGDSLAPYVDPYFGSSALFGSYPAVTWASNWKIYDAMVNTPTYFTRNDKRQSDTIKSHANRSIYVDEAVTATYLMGDMKLFNNHMRLVGGFRYERTDDSGYGVKQDSMAIYQRNPATGELIIVTSGTTKSYVRKPEAGAAGSPAETSLIYQYRGTYNERSYDGFFPSASMTVNITKDLILRLGYAQTIGRPAIGDIVPSVSYGVYDAGTTSSSGAAGWVISNNTELVPWTANNYDISLEYYLPSNGVVSVGVFRKDIANFFAKSTRFVTQADIDALGLPDDTLGYDYTTRFNAGNARIDGYELNYSQSLGFLGRWGKPFSIFANYTHLSLMGNNYSDFKDFIPETGNVGLTVSIWHIDYVVAMNYRGKQVRDRNKSDFPGAIEYIRARTTWDMSLNYKINKYFGVFAAVRNLTNADYQWEVSGGDAPDWATLTNNIKYGAQWTFGVKASF